MKYTLEHAVSPLVPGGVAYFLKEVDDGYDLIQVRRGLKADLPATLEPGEPAFCMDTREFYIGGPDGTPTIILGHDNGYTDEQIDAFLALKQDVLTFDSTPTQDSSNPVTSGGLFVVLGNKADLVNGSIPPAQLPPEVFEHMVVVADDAARFALTTTDVQNGDVVYVDDTQVMYYVVDDTHLDSEAGYKPFAANIAAKAIGDKNGNDITTTYQLIINALNKLSADYVDDSNSTNKFVTASDKTTWNSKQDALVVGTNLDNTPVENSTNPVTSGGVYAAIDNFVSDADYATTAQAGIVKPDGTTITVDAAGTISVATPNLYVDSNGYICINYGNS